MVAAVERVQLQRVEGAGRPEAQGVGVLVAVADDGRVERDGEQRLRRVPAIDGLAVLPCVADTLPPKLTLYDSSGRWNSQGFPEDSQFSGRSCCQPSWMDWRNSP